MSLKPPAEYMRGVDLYKYVAEQRRARGRGLILIPLLLANFASLVSV